VGGIAELFVITLARASRRARRYLKGMDSADRDDVLGSAILWCWENRALYNPSVPLDDWFVGAIRNARRDWSRGESRQVAEIVEDFPAPDTTLALAQSREAAERLAATLSDRAAAVAALVARGYSRRLIGHKLRLSDYELSAIQKDLRRLRHLLPDETEFRATLRAASRGGSDSDARPLAPIDREIEKLEFSPPPGKECPPCWRCKWFEGFLPGDHVPVRMPIREAEVRDAVLNTEARKVYIARRVRDDTINRG
jgi:RNA polymerase sigma factor (sigma-70 family)